ncbi:MAG TPA: hypothetical protein VMS77_00080 [Conexivisphaerales archaeon]|nr:hypothetical protein [Conexivisphaerales archaeon]
MGEDRNLSFCLAIGIGVGVAIGAAIGNLAIWTALGAPIGLVFYGLSRLLKR